MIRNGRGDIVKGCLAYQAYVCKQTYDDLENWEPERRNLREAAWPEYADSALMLSRPTYQGDAAALNVCSPSGPRSALLADGEAWLKNFRRDVQLLQEHKQHHIHIPDSG